jgi:hypothetical protein
MRYSRSHHVPRHETPDEKTQREKYEAIRAGVRKLRKDAEERARNVMDRLKPIGEG